MLKNNLHVSSSLGSTPVGIGVDFGEAHAHATIIEKRVCFHQLLPLFAQPISLTSLC